MARKKKRKKRVKRQEKKITGRMWTSYGLLAIGSVLILSGLLLFGLYAIMGFRGLRDIVWPILLVILGIYFIVRERKKW